MVVRIHFSLIYLLAGFLLIFSRPYFVFNILFSVCDVQMMKSDSKNSELLCVCTWNGTVISLFSRTKRQKRGGMHSLFECKRINSISIRFFRNQFRVRVVKLHIIMYNCIMANPSKLNLQETGFNFQTLPVSLSLTISHHRCCVALLMCDKSQWS